MSFEFVAGVKKALSPFFKSQAQKDVLDDFLDDDGARIALAHAIADQTPGVRSFKVQNTAGDRSMTFSLVEDYAGPDYL